MRVAPALTCLCLLMVVDGSHTARILAVVPTPSVSHQLPLRAILLELAKRGHQVTFITTDPIRVPTENYTEVDVSLTYDIWKKKYDFTSMADLTAHGFLKMFAQGMGDTCEVQLNSTQLKEFMKLEQKFDLFIIEKLGYGCYYGLAHKVGSPPLVGFVSFGASYHVLQSYGSPVNPSYMSDLMVGYSDHMTFWQRLYSAGYMLFTGIWAMRNILPIQEAIMRKHFGPNPPPVLATENNFSLLLANNHFSMSYPVPITPNIIELTGLHLQKNRKPLPQDIKQFLDGANDGVVYFSLGSNVKSSTMSPEKLHAFVEAFAELPQRVLWKWETDKLPGKPNNVMAAKWLPQQDILAHPNIRLFITQGGLQSVNEAAYNAVPMVGIPFIADQHFDVEKIVAAGIGVKLNFNDVTKDNVLKSINVVLGDKSYRENMKRFSAVYREHQETSLDRAIWWVEYVLRHKGAPHLRSAALDLHWWQLLLLDVIGFVLAVTAVIAFILYKLLQYVIGKTIKSSKLKAH